MQVRRATVKDIPAIVGMARDFYSAHDFRFPFSPEHFSVTAADFVRGGNKLCLVVGDPAGAVFMAQYGTSQISPIRVADELLIWASPQARKGALRAFVQEYEKWAADSGCQICQLSAQSQIRPAAMGRVFEWQGYSSSDIRYIKKI